MTTVANFEVKLEEAKARQEEIENQPISEEEIFQKMVKMVEEEDEIAQDEISNEDLIQNYLRDCSNLKQTPPRGQNTSGMLKIERQGFLHKFLFLRKLNFGKLTDEKNLSSCVRLCRANT